MAMIDMFVLFIVLHTAQKRMQSENLVVIESLNNTFVF